MAQYYQVTSLEELHKLYPNLQLDNLEGVSCMIQDDQVATYTDGQGQQVIATIERSGVQLAQNLGSPPQCTSQQSQFVVHQPTQYVIQQMDPTESQTSVQYIQHRTQAAQTKEDISLVQFKDKVLNCVDGDMGNEEHSLQSCIVKSEDSQQQYLPQVPSVLQQPIQIHQPIQAVDMGGNILVLQNKEQPDLFINQSKNQELLCHSPEKQHQQQSSHILIQRHQQSKPQQIQIQKQIVQKDENSEDSSQILQSRSSIHSGGQQQQIIHQINQQSPPQVLQPLQYFNQVTVIDSYSQPRVTIEHHPVSNENLGQQQIQPQMQQFRGKKTMPQTVIQQQHVLVPQTFEMSSPPSVCNNLSQTKKIPQQDSEGSTAPVFIVQKVDSPFLVRQHQAKFRFQSPSLNSEKLSENSYQSVSTSNDQHIIEHVIQDSRHIIPTSVSNQQVEAQNTISLSDECIHSRANTSDRSLNYNQVKLDVVEKPFENRTLDQKLKVSPPFSNRPQVARLKTTEQQTDFTGISDGKEVCVQTFPKFANNNESQVRPTTASLSQMEFHSPLQASYPSRGRGIRGPSPRGYQLVQRPRAAHVQTSPPPRLTTADRGGQCKRLKSPRGGGKSGRGGWTAVASNQRPAPPIRPPAQLIANSPPKAETSQNPNENTEEARMVVLLINGEKKIIKIPCSQNILLGQLLQQAGLSITTTTPVTVEHIVENASDQLSLKGSTAINPQTSINLKSPSSTQIPSVVNSIGTPRNVISTLQQRPRIQSPQTPLSSNVGVVKHRLQFASPRMPSPDCTVTPKVITNVISETTSVQPQNAQNSTPSSAPQKEEPRFVTGFMAICPFCGISSLDFNKCIRCRRKLPENVKSQSIFSIKKKKDKASGGSEKNDDSKSEIENKQLDKSGTEGKERNISFQGSDKKKTKPCLKKKKISDEPAEILILSSDEEDETKCKKTNVNVSGLSALRKEPVYTDILTEAEMINLLKEGYSLSEDIMKNIPPGSFTVLQCRTIRIGSYKVQPKERIFLTTKGFKLVINSLKNEIVTVIIPTAEIIKILIHFGKQIPVIFIYPTPKIGAYIRGLLGMDSKVGPYYDPTSNQEETHKRITLLLEKCTEDSKIVIKKIFGQDKLEELSEKEANEILIRASPVEMQTTSITKSTDSVRKIMVYPPPPEKGGITLNNQDYACLGEDQFLNDVIIDFYLKYLLLKVLSPTDRNRTHVFSTFFYKRLTTKPKTLRKNDPENDPKLSPAEKRHMRVKGWTKQVNLFEKDFIIVPINEHSHWFLAIICFPGLTGPVRFSDNTPVEPEEVTPKKNSQTLQIGSTTITHIIKTDGSTISLEVDSGSDRDEAEGDQDDLHPSSDDEGSEQVEEETNTSSSVQIPLLGPQAQATAKDSKSKTPKRRAFKEPIKQPCILIFDSLAGASRVRVVATLRDYLRIEYKNKMGHERDFSKDTIKGAVPKVPQQNNFTDCGLYVLQYVESFFQDPLHDFKLPLKYLQDWFPEEVVSCKRQKLASLIRSLMEEQGIKVEEMGLPALTFTNGNNTGDDQSRMEDEDVEEEEELNEEEEEMLRRGIHVSAFENEDEEMNAEDEDEEDDEDDEDEEYDDDDEEEELEVGEIPRHWLARASGSCNERHGKPLVFTTNALVEYDPSDNEEDSEDLPSSFVGENEGPGKDSVKVTVEKQYCISEPSLGLESKKSVPMTEYQDFESQISCTTIERNLEGKTNESSMIVNESEEVVEEECKGNVDEEESSFEASDSGNLDETTKNFNQSYDRKTFSPNTVYVKDGSKVQVSDIIKKLVNENSITISRKEDELNSSVFRKHLDAKKFKVKDCDKGEEVKNTCPSSPPKVNITTYKRSFQALKSVRIPKKTERNLELCSKRQKVDET